MTPKDTELQFSQSVNRARLTRAQFAAEHVELPSGVDYDFSWSGESNYVARLDVLFEKNLYVVDGVTTALGADARGRNTFLPSGSAVSGSCRLVDRRNHLTLVYFDRDFLTTRCNEPPKNLTPRLHFIDRDLGGTLEKIDRLLQDDSLVDDILFDALVLLAAIEATRRTGSEIEIPRGGLSASQARRMRDFIEENLHREISLGDLADIACLSEFHFSRAFQESFGASPYRYLLTQRVERAKALLREGDQPILEVGKLTGFRNASQFSRTFRTITGETPRDYQRRASKRHP